MNIIREKTKAVLPMTAGAMLALVLSASARTVQMPRECTTPDGMCVAADGALVIAAPNNDHKMPGAIFRLASPGATPVKWFEVPANPETGYSSPMGVCFGPEGELYVCDNQKDSNGRILVFTFPDGSSAAPRMEVVACGLDNANGVKYLNGRLYVTQAFLFGEKRADNAMASGLFMFDAKARNQRAVNSHASAQCVHADWTVNPKIRGGLNGVATDGVDTLFTGNYGDGHVWKLKVGADGRVVKSEIYAKDHEKLVTPDGFCLDRSGDLFIADMHGCSLVKVTAAGKVEIVKKGGFNRPSEPCCYRGNVYVANYGGTTLETVATGEDVSSGDGGCPVDPEARGHENIEWSTSYAYHLTDASRDLPRVLMIGDSICNAYKSEMFRYLEGKVSMTYWVSSYCVTSAAFPKLLELYLNEAKYKVVHFNNGLHTPRSTDIGVWKRKLKESFLTIRRLQPQARIVWTTITPLKTDERNAHVRKLNAAALEAVREVGGIAIDDLYALDAPMDRARNWSDLYHHHRELVGYEAKQAADSAIFNAYDETAAVQSKIDAAWKNGGGEVVLAKGEHYIRSLRLRSNVTLRMAAGAKVNLSREFSDYEGTLLNDPLEPVTAEELASFKGENLARRSQSAAFVIYRAKNVRIVGEQGAKIDGRNCYGGSVNGEGYRGPHTFWAVLSENLEFRGVNVVNAGDYAYKFVSCRGVRLDGVSAAAGHDGIHFDLCEGVTAVNCDLRTGDDSIAGSGCTDIVISNCVVNSACSPFRLCGKNVLVTDCVSSSPAEHPHRWSLSAEEKCRGANSKEVGGRRTTGCFYQGYTGDKAHAGFFPGNMVVRNCKVSGPNRFMVSLSGLPGALWQDGNGIREIVFENIEATDMEMPSVVVAKDSEPMRIVLRNCAFGFRTPQQCVFFGKNVTVVDEGVKLVNADKLYENRPDVSYDDIPEFPSWRVEPKEQRAKWGLPPLSKKASKPLKFLFMSDHHFESDFVEGAGITKGKPVYTMWKAGNHAAIEKTYEFISRDEFCRDCDFAFFCGDQINTGYTSTMSDLKAEMVNYHRVLEKLDLHRLTLGKVADLDFVAEPWEVAQNLPRSMKPYRVDPLPPPSRVIAIQGNHDTGVDEFYRDCAFTADGVRFICFFASYVGLKPPPGKLFHSTAKISDRTLSFIEREMKRAREDPSIRHIVLASHWAVAEPSPFFVHPIIGACKENGMSGNRDRLLALAEKYGCRLFINGHEHCADWPVGKAGVMSDINCGTLTAEKGASAFAIVEIDDDEARFNVYSRATVEERDGKLLVTAMPRRLFVRTIPLK